ncbi:MAG: helix-turn-helix domain containing protein [Gemmatimonadota bacterium]|nr:helix-turn-helix domain containing protein [Gemmatimonadota bacterium]
MAVPELIVSRDRLIELVRDGSTPEQIAEMFRVDTAIIRDMIRRLEQNGYYDLLYGPAGDLPAE